MRRFRVKSGKTNATEKIGLEKEKLMMAILDKIRENVFTIDFKMKAISLNQEAERITRYSAGKAVGKS